jgi:aminoglycoside phosphotransferase (APT) family kinase protein
MKENVEGYRGPMGVRIRGRQSNPTFTWLTALAACTCCAEAARQALPSAHQVDHEYRVIKALAEHTDVLCPSPRALCDDSVIGTIFISCSSCPAVFWVIEDAQHRARRSRQIFD